MSKLDELIKELCPNGVEIKELNEVIISLSTGLNPRQFFKLNTENALNYYVTIREMHSGKIVFTDKTDRINDDALKLCNNRSNLECGDVLFSGTGTIGETVVIEETPRNWNIKEGVYAIKPNPTFIESRYLSYLLGTSKVRNHYMKKVAGGTVKSIPMAELKKLKLPIPPLEVQHEIVRILDSFTELTVELTDELKNRKKQYEYYREMLLSPMFDYVYLTLDEISENCDRQRKPVTKGNRTAGKYPYYGASGVVDYVSDYIFDGDYLLVSEDGANLLIRSTPIAFSISGKTWVNNHAHVLKFDSYELRRYVEIYLNSIDLSKYISGGAQPKLNQDNLNKILIPVPDNKRMKYIVNILDRFDAICNDLSSGLPAEIEARQKQYEYYRDKLLNFEEKIGVAFR